MATARGVAADHRDGDGAFKSSSNAMLCYTAKSPTPTKRRRWEVDMYVPHRIHSRDLRRVDEGRRSRRVYAAAAAAMVRFNCRLSNVGGAGARSRKVDL